MGHEYRLPDGDQAARLREISADSDLGSEVKLARWCAEAVAAKNPATAAQLATAVARIVDTDRAIKLREHSLLNAQELQALARLLGSIVYDTLLNQFPADVANRLVDEIALRWDTAFHHFKQTGAVPQLTCEPAALPGPRQEFPVHLAHDVLTNNEAKPQ